MTIWQRTLNIKDLWEQREAEEISVEQLAHGIGARLKALAPFDGEHAYLNDTKDDLAEQFEEFSGDEVEDFDWIMSELYDWADIQIGGKFFDAKKVCWVKTWG
jgi:hypothetical protein